MFGEGLGLACFINALVKDTTADVKSNVNCSGLLSDVIRLSHGFICCKHFTVDDLLLISGFQIVIHDVIDLTQINS